MKNQKQYPVVRRTQYNPIKRKTNALIQRQSQRSPSQNRMFQGNLAQNMKFGAKGHDLSAFVQRTVIMKDRHGNMQIAKERQFFNSSKNPMRVRIRDDERD